MCIYFDHLFEHLLCEAARHTPHSSDEEIRLDKAHAGGQVLAVEGRLSHMSNRLLLAVFEAPLSSVFRAPDEPCRICHKELGLRHAHLIRQQREAPKIRGARAMEEIGLFAQLCQEIGAVRTTKLESTHEGCHGHGPSTLDVIIVSQEFLAVLCQQWEGIVRVEVLELEQAAFTKQGRRRQKELSHEIPLTTVSGVHHSAGCRFVHDSRLLHPCVHWVTADVDVICVALRPMSTYVQDHWNGPTWVDPGEESVEVELANGNAHAPGPEVAQTKDTPSVREDDAVAYRLSIRTLLKGHLGVLF
mmetsp:Transcript_28666/g.62545  ORF Transcript_28666/g.62545 Transcript_28666/m.62545 type:complete len:302 (+) Transcript_28666:2577-3482(+)